MKSYRILQMGNGLIIEAQSTAPQLDKIPAGIYRLSYDPEEKKIILFDRGQSFNLPAKIYGKHHAYKKMILKALNTRDESVGVLLLGQKGAGKTILAHDLCNTAVTAGHPVFIIETQLPAALLETIAKMVGGECVFLFDEFCVTYSDDSKRSELLTFFSSRETQKALYLVMQNDSAQLPDAFLNRTGRFLFRLDYSCLTRPEAQEIINDFIVEPDRAEILLDYVDQVAMSSDTLISLLKQMAAFGADADLDLLFQVLNVPRPVYVNLEFKVGVDPETPLPVGAEIFVKRLNKTEYRLMVKLANGELFSGSSVEVSTPLVGRGGHTIDRPTWEGGSLPTAVNVYLEISSRGVGTLNEYHAPILEFIDWIPKKKKENND